MKKTLFYALLCLALPAPAEMDAAEVSLHDGVLTFTEDLPCGKINIVFSKCMENDLFTFSSISIDDKLVNRSSSDNIGPFLSSDGWFMGGNHLGYDQSGPKTANTVSYSIYIDGKEIAEDKTYTGNVVTIDVNNEIFYSDGKKFCDEIMKYEICGNSVDVHAHHDFTYPEPVKIKRYYGAQSMFQATELLLPGAADNQWIKLGREDVDLLKSDFARFSTFIEKCASGYQAVAKYDEGIGDASCVSDDGEVYLFRNYGGPTGKSYHVMMWDHTVKPGDKTDWHALYTWFNNPETDTFRETDKNPVFEYTSFINGQENTMHLDSKGTLTAKPLNGKSTVK